MDEPRAYYTEWSKSERGQLISFINAYIESIERWYWWTYLQSCDRDTDTENRLMDKGRGEEREGKRNGKSSMGAYTLTYIT